MSDTPTHVLVDSLAMPLSRRSRLTIVTALPLSPHHNRVLHVINFRFILIATPPTDAQPSERGPGRTGGRTAFIKCDPPQGDPTKSYEKQDPIVFGGYDRLYDCYDRRGRYDRPISLSAIATTGATDPTDPPPLAARCQTGRDPPPLCPLCWVVRAPPLLSLPLSRLGNR